MNERIAFYNGILQHTVAQIKKKIGAIRMSVIEVNRLTKDYGHGRGVFDVSARVDKGRVLWISRPKRGGKEHDHQAFDGFSKPQGGNTGH